MSSLHHPRNETINKENHKKNHKNPVHLPHNLNQDPKVKMAQVHLTVTVIQKATVNLLQKKIKVHLKN